jgi:hypothetical protein
VSDFKVSKDKLNYITQNTQTESEHVTHLFHRFSEFYDEEVRNQHAI